MEKQLLAKLAQGARRTPHKKQDLVRITLRRYLPRVIEEEAIKQPQGRVTNVEPWPKNALEKAWKVTDKCWDKIEKAVVDAQPAPSFDD